MAAGDNGESCSSSTWWSSEDEEEGDEADKEERLREWNVPDRRNIAEESALFQQ